VAAEAQPANNISGRQRLRRSADDRHKPAESQGAGSGEGTTINSPQEIDWKSWNDKIVTKGLVQKVQDSYTELSKQEYEIDRIADTVFKT